MERIAPLTAATLLATCVRPNLPDYPRLPRRSYDNCSFAVDDITKELVLKVGDNTHGRPYGGCIVEFESSEASREEVGRANGFWCRDYYFLPDKFTLARGCLPLALRSSVEVREAIEALTPRGGFPEPAPQTPPGEPPPSPAPPLQPEFRCATEGAVAVLTPEDLSPCTSYPCSLDPLAQPIADALNRVLAGAGCLIRPGKDLVEMKLVFCEGGFRPDCMAMAGRSLGADYLLYGQMQKDSPPGRNTLKLGVVNVTRQQIGEEVSTEIPRGLENEEDRIMRERIREVVRKIIRENRRFFQSIIK